MNEVKSNIVNSWNTQAVTIFRGVLLIGLLGLGSQVFGQVSVQEKAEIDEVLESSRNALTSYHYDKAIELGKEALSKSNQAEYNLGMINSLFIIGESLKGKRDYSTGLNYYLQALSEIEKQNNKQYLYDVNYRIGELFYDWGVPEKALIYFNNAKDIEQHAPNESSQVLLLVRIAETYLKLNQRSEALAQYQKVLTIHKKNENTQQTLNTLKKIASIHNQLDEYQRALEYNFEILAINEQQKDSTSTAVSLNTIGFLYKDLNEPANALVYFNRALQTQRTDE